MWFQNLIQKYENRSDSALFLDEPTTGIDVDVRRQIWDAINKLKSHTSIVLTTHSMEEVEELADRISIMINGSVRCLGTSSHLKAKFGAGWKLSIKTENAEMTSSLAEWIIPQLSYSLHGYKCTVSRHIGSTLMVELNRRDETSHDEKAKAITAVMRVVFNTLESVREKYSIVNYELDQTTLDQVFLEMTKDQKTR
jgi:ABC-type multidrug transport system ATPase subunit